MVLSTTKKTASIASITNQNQGGGSKKAGLPYIIGRSSWSSIALKNTSQRLSVLMPMTMVHSQQVSSQQVSSEQMQ